MLRPPAARPPGARGGLRARRRDAGAQLPLEEQQLLSVLGCELVDLDSLAVEGQFSAAELSRLLVSLELKGLVENRGGYYQRLS